MFQVFCRQRTMQKAGEEEKRTKKKEEDEQNISRILKQNPENDTLQGVEILTNQAALHTHTQTLTHTLMH